MKQISTFSAEFLLKSFQVSSKLIQISFTLSSTIKKHSTVRVPDINLWFRKKCSFAIQFEAPQHRRKFSNSDQGSSSPTETKLRCYFLTLWTPGHKISFHNSPSQHRFHSLYECPSDSESFFSLEWRKVFREMGKSRAESIAKGTQNRLEGSATQTTFRFRFAVSVLSNVPFNWR